jgi:hypothetical protein
MSRGNQALKDLIADLGKMPPELRKHLRTDLRESAQRPLADAKARASWSKRIPAATRLSVSFSKRKPGVALTVRRLTAPHARPLENQGRPGTVRHPVFGRRDRWAAQPARPFLWPAAQPWVADTDRRTSEVVLRVAREHGFR